MHATAGSYLYEATANMSMRERFGAAPVHVIVHLAFSVLLGLWSLSLIHISCAVPLELSAATDEAGAPLQPNKRQQHNNAAMMRWIRFMIFPPVFLFPQGGTALQFSFYPFREPTIMPLDVYKRQQ